MRATRLPPSRLAKSFNQSVEKVEARAQKFLEAGDAPNTQALRRATKRLRTAYSVLPRRLRRDPRVRRYVEASRRLSKATGQVRDLDTIAAWTSQLSDSKDRRSLLSGLEKARGSTLRGASREAKQLLETRTPSVEPERLPQPGLEKRVEKVERRLVKRVDKEFEEFLSTQEVEVMHELRKDSKRLRHLLELTRNGHAPPLLDRLRSIQDDLGAIRDHDLVIDYLRRMARLTSTRSLIREAIAKRHAKLEDFVTKNRGQGRVVPVPAK